MVLQDPEEFVRKVREALWATMGLREEMIK
jgi:hypothetical protein